MVFDLIVIGGGAAGFYGAIQAGELKAGLKVLIVERSTKLLSKVRVSGGGRCNVTHNCFNPVELATHYPRGSKFLRRTFKLYNAADTIAWFSKEGVKLKVEEDGRMFPSTDNSETIIECFRTAADRLGIRIQTGFEVARVVQEGGLFRVEGSAGQIEKSHNLLIATGGSPKPEAYSFIKDLGHTIRNPIPSLFTFNDSGKDFSNLMGIAVETAEVRIAGSKFRQVGPVLITHWGLSGPAVIRLSAWAAEYLHSVGYKFDVLVSWIGPVGEEEAKRFLYEQRVRRIKQKIWKNPLYNLPHRLWMHLCSLSEIPETKVWGEISNRNLNKLMEYLIRCPFHIKGKTTFKEEFVTCGGVLLEEVDPETMQSRKVPGLYFAGEVLDVDGETGGFNFQGAWTTAFLAARTISQK